MNGQLDSLNAILNNIAPASSSNVNIGEEVPLSVYNVGLKTESLSDNAIDLN